VDDTLCLTGQTVTGHQKAAGARLESAVVAQNGCGVSGYAARSIERRGLDSGDRRPVTRQQTARRPYRLRNHGQSPLLVRLAFDFRRTVKRKEVLKMIISPRNRGLVLSFPFFFYFFLFYCSSFSLSFLSFPVLYL
jgi:hypothetical protein